MVSSDAELADAYATAVAAAAVSAVSAEPEAQLTVPVAVLLEGLAATHGLGVLKLVREAQLKNLRPDFAALLGGRAAGWIELKAPGHSLDGANWVGREKRQWALLAELDALLVCNGQQAVLYQGGVAVGDPAELPYAGNAGWTSGPLVDLLRLLVTSRPAVVTRPSQLAERLAPLARMLKDRIAAGLTTETPSVPVQTAKAAWSQHIHEHVDDAGFADDLAQVVSYSMAIAALRGGADKDGDELVTLDEARQALKQSNEVLAAAIGPALEIQGLTDALAAELGAIERLASAVDAVKVAAAKDSRGEPWLWFYEDFLAAYDPERRKQSGVYYTPTDVVAMQVRHVDHILREHFNRKLGFGDKAVVTLDPATGSGTYPLAVLDRAAFVAEAVRGAAGPAQVAPTLAKNLLAFELLPGPYAVAHLRIGQRLAEMANQLIPPGHVRVYLTDTLDDPSTPVQALNLWGDVAVLAAERAKAAEVKSTQPVTVVLGNPPYKRRAAGAGGGWVLHPASGRPLFDDVTQPPKDTNVIFSAQASLFNDYMYFWRWAINKAFEQKSGPAAVSFITAASWLNGPAFLGLRQLARNLADQVWIVDLGGEGRGSIVDENVFAIQTPVAVVTLFRKGATTKTPATAYYRRVTGTRAEKLAALPHVHAPDQQPDAWTTLDNTELGASFTPTSGGVDWQQMPALVDLFPWQQPGAMLNRSWPIAPDPELLQQRWDALLSRTGEQRSEAFVTPTTGRTTHTQVAGLPPLAELAVGSAPQPTVRYAFRSFDRQWTLRDPRVAALERPALWASLSDQQMFLTTLTTTSLGSGPAITVTTSVPDKHHFSGRGGKDIIPLYRDHEAQQPNVPHGLLDHLEEVHGFKSTVEDLAAYVVAVLAHPGYQERFADELESPGPRVPLTAEPKLFARVRDLGRHLLWVQTFTERCRDAAAGRGQALPAVAGLGWSKPVEGIPSTDKEITYDPALKELTVGSGVVSGVPAAVWTYEVSGFAVLPRWLGSRTKRGVGRAATRPTVLDLIRPTAWADEWNDELLDLIRVLAALVVAQPQQNELLDAVLQAPLLAAGQLPFPSAAERAVPASTSGTTLADPEDVSDEE